MYVSSYQLQFNNLNENWRFDGQSFPDQALSGQPPYWSDFMPFM